MKGLESFFFKPAGSNEVIPIKNPQAVYFAPLQPVSTASSATSSPWARIGETPPNAVFQDPLASEAWAQVPEIPPLNIDIPISSSETLTSPYNSAENPELIAARARLASASLAAELQPEKKAEQPPPAPGAEAQPQNKPIPGLNTDRPGKLTTPQSTTANIVSNHSFRPPPSPQPEGPDTGIGVIAFLVLGGGIYTAIQRFLPQITAFILGNSSGYEFALARHTEFGKPPHWIITRDGQVKYDVAKMPSYAVELLNHLHAKFGEENTNALRMAALRGGSLRVLSLMDKLYPDPEMSFTIMDAVYFQYLHGIPVDSHGLPQAILHDWREHFIASREQGGPYGVVLQWEIFASLTTQNLSSQLENMLEEHGIANFQQAIHSELFMLAVISLIYEGLQSAKNRQRYVKRSMTILAKDVYNFLGDIIDGIEVDKIENIFLKSLKNGGYWAYLTDDQKQSVIELIDGRNNALSLSKLVTNLIQTLPQNPASTYVGSRPELIFDDTIYNALRSVSSEQELISRLAKIRNNPALQDAFLTLGKRLLAIADILAQSFIDIIPSEAQFLEMVASLLTSRLGVFELGHRVSSLPRYEFPPDIGDIDLRKLQIQERYPLMLQAVQDAAARYKNAN